MYIPVGFPQRLRYPRQTGNGDAESAEDDLAKAGLDASDVCRGSSINAASTDASATASTDTTSGVEEASTDSFKTVVANSIKTLFLCTSSREIALWKFRPQVMWL